MSLGGDDRLNGSGSSHSIQPDEGKPRTAKIIPLRTVLDASAMRLTIPVRFAGEEAPQAKAKITDPPVEPALRETRPRRRDPPS
jgi:hypothetical protein